MCCLFLSSQSLQWPPLDHAWLVGCQHSSPKPTSYSLMLIQCKQEFSSEHREDSAHDPLKVHKSPRWKHSLSCNQQLQLVGLGSHAVQRCFIQLFISGWYSGLWLHLPGPAKRQVRMLNPFTPSTFHHFHRACKETVSILNPFPPSTFYHFHRSHFSPFLQSLGLQQLTWNRVT